MSVNHKNELDLADLLENDLLLTDAVSLSPTTIEEARDLLAENGRTILKKCMGEIVGGVAAPAPSPAGIEFSIRDYAAVVEGFPELVDSGQLEEVITLVLDTQRQDGLLAECITFDGCPLYGDEEGNSSPEALDVPQAVVNLVWHGFEQSGNTAFVKGALDSLIRALQALPRNPKTELVYLNHPEKASNSASCCPQKLNKQGDLLIASLFYVRACQQLGDLLQSLGEEGQSDAWRAEGQLVAKRTRMYLWDKHTGLFRASSEGLNVKDVWGSALSVYVNAATSGQLMSIGNYLKDNYNELFHCGHLRHLADVSSSQPLEEPVGAGPNGDFWSLPAGWAAYSLNILAPDLADQVIIDLATRQSTHGVYQWITRADQAGGENHLASVVFPLGAVRRILQKRQQLAL